MIQGSVGTANCVELAEVAVELIDGVYQGKILRLGPDASLTELFLKYEDAVSAQLFVEVDRLGTAIDALSPWFQDSAGVRAAIKDLQLYPRLASASFQLV
jgi:hypothetical protein